MPKLKIAITQLVVVALGSALIIACGAWAHQRGHSWFIPFLPALAIVAVVSAYAIGQATIKLGLRRRLVGACDGGLHDGCDVRHNVAVERCSFC